jgi:hypothetical protein
MLRVNPQPGQGSPVESLIEQIVIPFPWGGVRTASDNPSHAAQKQVLLSQRDDAFVFAVEPSLLFAEVNPANANRKAGRVANTLIHYVTGNTQTHEAQIGHWIKRL